MWGLGLQETEEAERNGARNGCEQEEKRYGHQESLSSAGALILSPPQDGAARQHSDDARRSAEVGGWCARGSDFAFRRARA